MEMIPPTHPGIKHQKIKMKKIKVYIPGILSLLLLFPLIMYQLLARGYLNKNYVLEVTWYSPEISDANGQKFPVERNYTTINLTGNARNDKITVAYAKLLITEMLTEFDTTKGLHLHFADTAKYESFIEVLDFCDQQQTLSYAPNNSDFWIFNKVKNEQQKKMLFRSCTPIII
jgi:hypothetical protein